MLNQSAVINANLSERELVQRWDCLVIGAGPAGSIAALVLARRGQRVLLLDKAAFPRAKVCGCCLNSSALKSLAALDLLDQVMALAPNRLHQLQLRMKTGQANVALSGNIAVSRESFDAVLVRAAIAAGSSFAPRVSARVAGLAGDSRLVHVEWEERPFTLNASVVIVADGIAGSALASVPGFAYQIEPAAYIGAGTIARSAPSYYQPGLIYMAVGRSGYAGFVRLEDGTLDIAAAIAAQFVQRCGSQAQAVEAIMQEVGMPQITGLAEHNWRGTPALTRCRTRLGSERIFVIGDAALYSEPFTGEGMSWAIDSALAVEELATNGALLWNSSLPQEWRLKHADAIGKKVRASGLLASLLRHPALTGPALELLSRVPSLGATVARHIGGALINAQK